MANFFRKLFRRKPVGPIATTGPAPAKRRRAPLRRFATVVRRKLPRDLNSLEQGIRNINVDSVAAKASWIRWGITVLALFLVSAVASRIIALKFSPSLAPLPSRESSVPPRAAPPTEDFTSIEHRNIFDVENKIPPPFDQGLLECLSQAKLATNTGLTLEGTVVMGDDDLSVALVSKTGEPDKIAVKKNDVFFNRFQALQIARKKLCFQDRSTQDYEYIEIPEQASELGTTGPSLATTNQGIVPLSDTKYEVKQNFLASQLKDLNNVLQTAKAVPDFENGRMKGFLIQSIEPDSPFATLGLRQGDVLAGVNDITLDNAGKGLEAFQRLRNSNHVQLKIIRGGQPITLNYDVK